MESLPAGGQDAAAGGTSKIWGRKVPRKLLSMVMVACLAWAAMACSDDGDEASPAPTATSNQAAVEIGAILPLTGALSSYGETSKALLDEGVTAINAQSGRKVALSVEDSTSVPAVALQKLQALHGRGIRVVIGPYSSSEVN